MEEVSAAFSGGNVSVFVDGTLGAGGHSLRIFRDHAELDTLIGIDQDEGALRSAEAMLREQVAADGRHVRCDRDTSVGLERTDTQCMKSGAATVRRST